ncbi:MAG TPA: ketoacyl reductase, partial [Verrucomicrobiae bacterium]|nr:ketoacyl reductase [Verrucomicrobiae bacterium]
LPLLSTSAEKAARKIIEACRRGQARLMIGLHTKSAVVFHEAAPNLATAISSLANRWLLPGPGCGRGEKKMGYDSESSWSESRLTRLTKRAARNNNEISAPG